MRVVVVPGLVLAMKYLKSLAELTSVVPHRLLLYCHLDLLSLYHILLIPLETDPPTRLSEVPHRFHQLLPVCKPLGWPQKQVRVVTFHLVKCHSGRLAGLAAGNSGLQIWVVSFEVQDLCSVFLVSLYLLKLSLSSSLLLWMKSLLHSHYFCLPGDE